NTSPSPTTYITISNILTKAAIYRLPFNVSSIRMDENDTYTILITKMIATITYALLSNVKPPFLPIITQLYSVENSFIHAYKVILLFSPASRTLSQWLRNGRGAARKVYSLFEPYTRFLSEEACPRNRLCNVRFQFIAKNSQDARSSAKRTSSLYTYITSLQAAIVHCG